MKHNWFETWFNSKYYHVLYQNRDGSEARLFLDHLIEGLKMQPNSRILDVCCGKGRHAIYLNSKGFVVDGIDLAPENIKCAKAHECKSLQFHRADMRNLFRVNEYDYALNLFTSFGYFNSENDDIKAMKTMAACLKQHGLVVLDYLNMDKALEQLDEQSYQELSMDGIDFKIEKSLNSGFIEKKITFKDKGEQYTFMERVKALRLHDFERYMEQAGLKLNAAYGSYELDPFNPSQSERLILVAQKNNE